ncbi:MAG: hypothetical protein LBU39_01025 [Desulfobulbaceae bacterium]|jgi:hypothetical protein|nr:hypothetical protein [Desulfobulbaceae bacterium]
MANTLTNLIPTLYRAVDTVSRELTGMIPSVTLFPDAEQAAVGQSITYPVTAPQAPVDIVPGAVADTAGNQFVGNATMLISKSRMVPVKWNGEEQVGISQMYDRVLEQQFAQAMRALTNEIEADLCALYKEGSRAYGSVGQMPFTLEGDFTDATLAKKILLDNGAPTSGLKMVVGTTAGAYLTGRQATFRIQGDREMLTQGVIRDIEGMAIRQSSAIKTHMPGTGAGYLVNDTFTPATNPQDGSLMIRLDTGTGTILAGDIVTVAGSANKYVVSSDFTAPYLTLAGPSRQIAAIADNAAITPVGGYTANMLFHESAIHLLTKLPAMPQGGDSADDVEVITDPISGLSFQVALYRERRQIRYEIGVAWGVKAVKPAHIALLIQ